MWQFFDRTHLTIKYFFEIFFYFGFGSWLIVHVMGDGYTT